MTLQRVHDPPDTPPDEKEGEGKEGEREPFDKSKVVHVGEVRTRHVAGFRYIPKVKVQIYDDPASRSYGRFMLVMYAAHPTDPHRSKVLAQLHLDHDMILDLVALLVRALQYDYVTADVDAVLRAVKHRVLRVRVAWER